jgi:DNA gyrase/topoisomerase IV subunit A
LTAPDEIARAERARLEMLDAVYAGIQRRAEVLDVVSNADSLEDALHAIQQLLGLTEEHAQAVLDLQFGRLTRSSVTRIERDRERLRAEWG